MSLTASLVLSLLRDKLNLWKGHGRDMQPGYEWFWSRFDYKNPILRRFCWIPEALGQEVGNLFLIARQVVFIQLWHWQPCTDVYFHIPTYFRENKSRHCSREWKEPLVMACGTFLLELNGSSQRWSNVTEAAFIRNFTGDPVMH